MVGRVWPRHSGGGRPLNSVVRHHWATSMRRTLTIWATVGVPATFIAYVVAAVKVAGGRAPFLGAAKYWAIGLFALLLVTGAMAISRSESRRRLTVTLIYTVVMALALGIGAVVASVAAGDIQ